VITLVADDRAAQPPALPSARISIYAPPMASGGDGSCDGPGVSRPVSSPLHRARVIIDCQRTRENQPSRTVSGGSTNRLQTENLSTLAVRAVTALLVLAIVAAP